MNTTDPLHVESARLPWAPTGRDGHSHKPLHDSGGPEPRLQAQVLRLEPGATLDPPTVGGSLELVVLEGALTSPLGELGPEGYALLLPGTSPPAAGAAGCVLFIRRTVAPSDPEPIWQAAGEDPWLPGQGGLRVKPLGAPDSASAFVHWPAGERFVPHRHWGGEEIFVLSGTFRDEHGSYPAGSWLQSPHLSQHHPFVTEETVIFVKTGHLPIPTRSR